MISRIPLIVFLAVMMVLSVTSFFVHRLPYAASMSFNTFAIVWGVATTLRALQDRKALRDRA